MLRKTLLAVSSAFVLLSLGVSALAAHSIAAPAKAPFGQEVK